MDIQEEIRGDIVILRVSGAMFIASHVNGLHDRVKDIVARGCNKVVVDLQDVDWFGSATLGVLAASLMTLEKAGGGLCLANVAPKVMTILTVSHMIEVFCVAESVESCAEALG